MFLPPPPITYEDLIYYYFQQDFLPAGDIAALVYLWNPFTIFTCVGSSTSPIENFFVILTLYGACKSKKLKVFFQFKCAN